MIDAKEARLAAEKIADDARSNVLAVIEASIKDAVKSGYYATTCELPALENLTLREQIMHTLSVHGYKVHWENISDPREPSSYLKICW
jgi:hypothetical protein